MLERNNYMDIINISLAIVSLITAGLSLFIVRGKHSRQNTIFSLFILSISMWSFGMLLFWMTDSLSTALNWTRFYYVMAAAIPAFFLHFSYFFPEEKKVNLLKILIIYTPLCVLSVLIIIYPNLILKDIFLSGNGLKLVHINVINYVTYAVYFISYLLCVYVNLFKAYYLATDRIIKIQLKFIFIGTIASFIFAMFFDLVLPAFDYSYVWVGPLFGFVVVIVLMYAVFKHHLLNVKVIAAELFTVSLWMFILIRTLLAENNQERFINIGLLALTVIIGVLLVRNSRQEIRTREQIELLAVDLEKANVRLTDLDRQKSEFVSFATHQLRAPLTAMKGYGSLILEGDMGEVSEPVRNGVSRIYESTNTLVSIVDDYLNLSRIELGSMKYAFETIDLKSLIEDIIAESKPNIEKTGVAFSFTAENGGVDYRTTADRDKLKQVFMNILDNSLKYTPKGSITAKLSLDRIKHKFVFAIKDTGVGIAPETLPLLFQKFSRAENANRTNIRGTGLGLYVAKQMIEAHHGTIRAESPGEGKGSTFTVELEPFAKA